MRILITGAAGFVGRHLIRELAEHGHQPVALDMRFPFPAESAWRQVTADIMDPSAISRILAEHQVEAVAHLAAISFVPDGNADPAHLYAIDIQGTLNLLETVRRHRAGCRLLFVSTAHVYGNPETTGPLNETAPLCPVTPYAISKACADHIAQSYAREYRLPILVARPNNHTGPGQDTRFSIPAFAHQVRTAAGAIPHPPLRVGNLDSTRDFCDVRDVVGAYRLLIEQGQPGQAYNIASGRPIAMRDILGHFCTLAGIPPAFETDPARFRPTDRSPLLDTRRIREQTGWAPRIPLEQTLQDVWNSP